jgi:hypothetical protein
MHRHADLEQQGDVGVPQAVERDGPKTGLRDLRRKRIGKRVWPHYLAERGSEHKLRPTAKADS